MLQLGGDEQTAGPGLRDAARVVVWCLVIAMLLSAASVVAQAIGLPGLSIVDRVTQVVVFSSLLAVGLALAAASALSTSDARFGESTESPRLRAWARISVVLVASATVVAALYGTVAVLAPRFFGADSFVRLHWPVRLGFIAGIFASAILGAAALYCIGRARRPGRASDWPSWNVTGPTVVCLVLAVVVMAARAVNALFISPHASAVDRFAQASLTFNVFPVALAALAAVVLIATGGHHERRDGTTALATLAAGCIGLVTMVAAGYTVWYVATTPSSRHGFLEGIGSAARVGTICGALASGTLGVAAAALARRLRLSGAVVPAARDSEPEPLPESRPDSTTEDDTPTRTLRPGRLVVGGCLAIATVCSAAFDVTQVLGGGGPVPVGDQLVQVTFLVLFTIGLAFAAAVVVTTRLPARREADATHTAVNATVAVVAVSTIALSVYAISYVLFGRDNGPASFIARATFAQQVSYIANALAIALIAFGALSLLWRARPAPDFDPEDSIATLEPAP